MHSKLHVGLAMLFSVHDKHEVIAVICDAVLFDKVAQCNDIGDGMFTVLNCVVVPWHPGLVGHQHGATIAP